MAEHALAIVDPLTGEVLELADLVDLAALRDRLGEFKRAVDAVLSDVDVAICSQLDRENVRSSRAGEWQLKTEPAHETVWDVPRLSVALEALVTAGRITAHAARAALEPQPAPAPKPRARELNKLLAHADPAVAEAIDACRHAEPRSRRRVTVQRVPPSRHALRAPETHGETNP